MFMEFRFIIWMFVCIFCLSVGWWIKLPMISGFHHHITTIKPILVVFWISLIFLIIFWIHEINREILFFPKVFSFSLSFICRKWQFRFFFCCDRNIVCNWTISVITNLLLLLICFDFSVKFFYLFEMFLSPIKI